MKTIRCYDIANPAFVIVYEFIVQCDLCGWHMEFQMHPSATLTYPERCQCGGELAAVVLPVDR